MQPIWVDREKSGDFFSGSNKFKYPFYPQRVSLSNPSNQNAEELNTTPGVNSDSDIESSLDENSANYSSSDSEVEEAEVIDSNEECSHF